MFLTLGQFAAAVSAPRKWVLNAHAVLGLEPEYSVERAKTFAVARMLENAWSIPLKRAFRLAEEILALPEDEAEWRIVAEDGLTTLSVDRNRVLSRFAATLSFALEGYSERRSGRPRRKGSTGIAAAREYGVDVSLLESSLERTPAERLRRLDCDAAFIGGMKMVDP